MIYLEADKALLRCTRREVLSSGAQKVYTCHYRFSSDWDGLDKTALFRAGSETYSVLLDETQEAVIPWEVLQNAGVQVYAGVYGTDGNGTVLPTIWTLIDMVHQGTTEAEAGAEPTVGAYAAILAALNGMIAGDGTLLGATPIHVGDEAPEDDAIDFWVDTSDTVTGEGAASSGSSSAEVITAVTNSLIGSINEETGESDTTFVAALMRLFSLTGGSTEDSGGTEDSGSTDDTQGGTDEMTTGTFTLEADLTGDSYVTITHGLGRIPHCIFACVIENAHLDTSGSEYGSMLTSFAITTASDISANLYDSYTYGCAAYVSAAGNFSRTGLLGPTSSPAQNVSDTSFDFYGANSSIRWLSGSTIRWVAI